MSKRAPKQTEKQAQWSKFIEGYLTAECCDQPMNCGYDVVMVYEFDFSGEAQAYYQDCQSCGNIETRRHEFLYAEFEDEFNQGTRW